MPKMKLASAHVDIIDAQFGQILVLTFDNTFGVATIFNVGDPGHIVAQKLHAMATWIESEERARNENPRT